LHNAAARSIAMEGRSERVLVATKEWRVRADEGFKAIGRGAMARCAREVGCSQAAINRILNGLIVASEFVGPISDWLAANGVEVARPQASISDEAEHELLEEARALGPEEFSQLLSLARLLRRNR
jgi:hypothetical protein